jgi:DNA replication protein DnaC
MSPVASTCPICEGTGWKSVATNSGDPAGPGSGAAGRNGSPRRGVVRCDCALQARGGRLLVAARIPRRYEERDLGNFDLFPGADPSLERARLVAAGFIENYPGESTGLMFVGPCGVGKTHLAVAILRELILTRGVVGLFCDYRELLKEIQNSYNASVSTTELQVLRPVFEAEVLVLDELGAVKPTEWVWDTVSHILNTRFNEKKTTIITTNYPDEPPLAANGESVVRSFSAAEQARAAARRETLGDRITERMRSRLHEMCRTIAMHGQDFRQRVSCAKFQ